MGSEFWSLVLSGTLAAYIALKIGYESYRYHGFSQAASSANEDELPTVSVCIPARNEMHALFVRLHMLGFALYLARRFRRAGLVKTMHLLLSLKPQVVTTYYFWMSMHILMLKQYVVL